MKISAVIAQLQALQMQYGDLEVVGSADEEQNTLGSIFDIQCGLITKYDFINSDKIKEGDRVVVLVPEI